MHIVKIRVEDTEIKAAKQHFAKNREDSSQCQPHQRSRQLVLKLE